ncbi:23S rRNA (guanosine(2251)-2'-O)-methyltransferase RlmB [Helicobacter sp. MIT 05-5293]|uniref:23S rRNA (guanosine(2251)-2'-O)-methyltransferase RlmB n=1 Tax=Helicobacter sp. MIT 05-5293 TaxID=1548149 RepID=UPI00051CE3A8|nr:23S rRNA (guanosine(2251)-2'-O)-methyltransferase RlmB [Helicobacter sp. MIT 05-5293]TLD82235.1 23S rRNA (guanosine(2251)-2'-O)-methyltransferase RlmB [Helicobacter sp. MIT 05-5293]
MILYGKQPVFYALQSHRESIEEFYLAKELPKGDFARLVGANKPIKRVDSKKAQALARGGNHQGILAKITPPLESSFDEMRQKDSLLILCGITDVGNVGSIFRTAYALGVEGIVICATLSEVAQEGILRTSSGAFLDMPYCFYTNVLDIPNELKNVGFSLYGADMQGKDEYKDESKKWALFLGSESQGLSARLKHKMDKILSIKMEHHFDSLNVAVATGILIDRIKYAR